MRHVASVALRWVLTPVLLFVAVALVRAGAVLPFTLDTANTAAPVVVGFAIGLVVFGAGWQCLGLYVLGHELTHWFAAKLFLRQTGRMSVGSAGGSVAVERPNVWIVLAPYCVPLYALVWTGLYGAWCFWQGPPGEWPVRIFNLGLGLAYGFHVVLTVYALRLGQADLRVYGRVFSLALIVFCNLALLFAALVTAQRQWPAAVQVLGATLAGQWRDVLDIVRQALAAAP